MEECKEKAENSVQKETLRAYKYRVMKRWETKPGYAAARQIKDDRIRALKASGLNVEEAMRIAWGELDSAMSNTDLPVEQVKLGAPLVSVDGASETDFVSAARWVLDHLVVQVDLSQAPSPGAWAMLLWARESQSDFFKQVLPRALDIEAKRAAVVPVAEDEEEADIGDLLG